jgi:hypothetical protein
MNRSFNPCKRSKIRTVQRIGAHIAPLVMVGAALLTGNAMANSFTFAPMSTSAWSISTDGGAAVSNAPLTLRTGQTYTFDVSASGTHPFWIKTLQSTGSGNGYTGGGLSANGITSSTTITFNVPANAPNTLFYNCANHPAMTGTITIVHDLVFRDNFEGP